MTGIGPRLAIGGVRHQFRDTPGGFEGRPCVELPARVTAKMLRLHQWHLAVEFSHWVEFALARA